MGTAPLADAASDTFRSDLLECSAYALEVEQNDFTNFEVTVSTINAINSGRRLNTPTTAANIEYELLVRDPANVMALQDRMNAFVDGTDSNVISRLRTKLASKDY